MNMNEIQKAKVRKTNEVINVRMKAVKTADAEYLMFEDIVTGNMYKFAELSFNVSDNSQMSSYFILDE